MSIETSITDPDAFSDNRTQVPLMTPITSLMCSAKNSSGLTAPAPQWLKNGVIVVEDSGHISFSSGGTLLEIMNFVTSDAGVYQCIFNDTDDDAAILTTMPFRIDTGKTVITNAIIYPAYCILDYRSL